jgi:hypothetical protein
MKNLIRKHVNSKVVEILDNETKEWYPVTNKKILTPAKVITRSGNYIHIKKMNNGVNVVILGYHWNDLHSKRFLIDGIRGEVVNGYQYLEIANFGFYSMPDKNKLINNWGVKVCKK